MKPQVSPLFLKDEELNDGVELFFFANRDFARVADRYLDQHELGRAHFRALYFIARRPNMPVTDLIAILGVTKQSLNRVLKTLLDKDFVTLTPGVRDRRQRLLTLTVAGKTLADQLAQAQRAKIAAAYREAGPEAVMGFRRVLSNLVSNRSAALKGMQKG
jgi:DNA-binding MarR family transcriptional regulator